MLTALKRRAARVRIVTALLLALVLVSIVPMVLSQVRLIGINRDALRTAEERYLTRSAVKLSSDIEGFLRSSLANLKRVAEGLSIAASLAPGKDPFGPAVEASLLRSDLRSEQNFLVLWVVDAEGKGHGFQPDQIPAGVKDELGVAYRAAMRGETYIGLPMRAVGSTTATAGVLRDGGTIMALPIRLPEGEIIGVVEGFLSFRSLVTLFEGESRREVFAYLVDRRGRMILSSDRALGDSVSDAELVTEFVARPARLTRSYSRRNPAGAGEPTRRVLGTIAPVDGPQWGVVVEKGEELAYGSVSRMTSESTLVAVLSLLIAAAVGLFCARALSRPVSELAAKARLIAEGNYSQRVEVRGTREIAELARTFNTMSAAIEDAVEKIKKIARENQELFFNSIRALAAAIDAKDPYTRGHSERVARYAVVIARHMGLTADEVRKVRIAALLHDVGKIGIDDRILRKPTALTDEEFEVMKTHPVKGAVIMGQIPQLREVIPGMKHHHEKWDGTGYPDGLLREEIPLLARIVTVADTFDAMTTTRPYQKAMQLEFVVSRIKSFTGTRFDPQVVKALDSAFVSRDLEVVGEAARMAVSA